MNDLFLFADNISLEGVSRISISIENGFNYTSNELEFSLNDFFSFLEKLKNDNENKYKNTFIQSIKVSYINGDISTFFFDDETEMWIEGDNL